MRRIRCSFQLTVRHFFLMAFSGFLSTLFTVHINSQSRSTGPIQRLSVGSATRHSNLTGRAASLFSHWIVVTTVAPPTADVMFMARLPGWKVVVVGDEKTPSNWSYPNCVYLSLAKQRALGMRLADKLPVHSYSRKNLGYLYAILHGAKVIYDTDDDNRPLDKLTSFQTCDTTRGLLATNHTVFNPYPHFGQSTLWPRGFPLTAIGQGFGGTYRLSSHWATPLIQQGIVNGDPDVDALFRLTRKSAAAPRFNVTFDPVSPPVLLPAGTFSPFNSQNTLFLHKAFWALLIPTTTTFRVCDIWRGYWAQRLLWEIGGCLGFVAANARQERNVHRYLDDAFDETPMYFNTERLLEFLSAWSCPQEFSFFRCAERLSYDMARAEFWGVEDARNTQLWLQDLLAVGYPEPMRVYNTSNTCKNAPSQRASLTSACDHIKSRSINDTEINSSFIRYFAKERDAPSFGLSRLYTSVFSRDWLQVFRVCPSFNLTSGDLNEPHHSNFFEDILVIIIFHYPMYSNILYTEAAYRLVFPIIAYCGPDAASFTTQTYDIDHNLTFIEAEVDRGHIGYNCLIKAIAMGFRVAGYLVFGDDVLLNSWSFREYDKTKMWTTSENIFRLDWTRPDKYIKWGWWKKPTGRPALVEALSELSKLPVPEGVTPPAKHRQILERNAGGRNTILRGLVDTFYVPERLARDVTWYLTSFLKYRVFVELAVPVTLFGLQDRRQMETIKGSSVWSKERNDPWKFYNATHQHLHPVKFSSKRNQAGLCKHYIPVLIENIFKHKRGERFKTDLKYT